MKVRKTTFLQKQLMLLLFLISAGAFAQTPTFSAYAPSVVTHRSSITITGTNFNSVTSVRFNGITAAFSVVSSTSITAIVPEITTVTAGTSSPVAVSVVKSAVETVSDITLNYVAPAETPFNAGITNIITNFGPTGYFSTGAATTNAALQPDTSHSLLAFTYDGTQYSTAPNSELGTVLTSHGQVYQQGNFRALPINNIMGSTNAAGGGTNAIVLAKNIDGSSTRAVATSPSVRNLNVRDVLIDGIRGLDLGTGITNLPSSSVLSFQASNIISGVVNDAIPDILVSQVADPSDNAFDVFYFVDAQGNIVGNPVKINISGVNAVGTYKTDFFSLPTSTSINDARINGVNSGLGDTRNIRLVAYRLADFGITELNRSTATQFKVVPSGTSDPAFIAYNRSSFQIPAPIVSTQPASVALCAGTATFSAALEAPAEGTENPTYKWEKDGSPITEGTNGITGTNTATLSVPVTVTPDNTGIYTVLITNASGAVRTSPAYLNTVIIASSGSVTCYNASVAPYLEVGAAGNTPTYQWYRTTSTSAARAIGATVTAVNNSTDVLIAGATSARYTPPAGYDYNSSTVKYFAKVVPSALSGNTNCPGATKFTPVLEFRVNKATAGTASTQNASFCSGGSAVIRLSTDYVGSIEWQQSTDGVTFTPVTEGVGSLTDRTYRSNPLSVTTWYKAVVSPSSGGCAAAAVSSNIVKITVADTNIWLGTTDIYWNTATNWSCGTVPTVETKVLIPATTVQGRMPNVIGFQGYAKNITVENGARVTVLNTGTLNVADNIDVATGGFFTVENNGSLVQQNATTPNTGNVKVIRNSNSLFKLDYTLWSSPVAGQNLQAFSPSTLSTRFYEYGTVAQPTTANPNAMAEYYILIPNPSLTNFAPAKGFLIRMPNIIAGNEDYNNSDASTVFQGEFNGVPNNGTITYPLNTAAARYTAIGNPYASPISVADFFETNSNVLDGQTALYFWRKRNNTNVSSYALLNNAAFVPNTAYRVSGPAQDPDAEGPYQSGGQAQAVYYPVSNTGSANPSWRISQGQGFFVRAKAATPANPNPVVTFTNSMRREAPGSQGQAFFRSAEGAPVASRVWLNLAGSTEDSFSQFAVAYLADATLGLDYGLDGATYADNNNVSLYTIAEQKRLTIQARPTFTTTDVVPVGYKTAAAGNLTIAIDHFDGVFTDGQNIYLKDNTTGNVHDLRNGDYTFTSEIGRFDDRFELVYTNEALGTDAPQLNANSVIIFKEGSSININTGTAQMTDVTVYDVRGRVLFTKSGINATTTVVAGLQAAKEVLIVEVNTVKGKVSKKLVF